MQRRSLLIAGLMLWPVLVWPLAGWGHSFGVVYTLPVPFHLYAWGAGAALVASFVIVGFFVTVRRQGAVAWSWDITHSPPVRLAARWRLMPLARQLGLVALLLCMITGFVGTNNRYGNFNMTFFWIVFMLGFAYATALVGNVYAVLNPWQTITDAIACVVRSYGRGVLPYPPRLGYWPAVLLYGVFIWLELFGESTPFSLATMLAAYTALTVVGVGLVGRDGWFEYCDFLALFFRLIARMAPVDYRPAGASSTARVVLRAPFSGLRWPHATHISLLVFVLFMLSSTAFDGIHETAAWRRLFWTDLYREFLQYHTSSNPLAAFPALVSLYKWWQSIWLLLSPLLYLMVYLFFIVLTKWAARSQLSVCELALRFAYPLLPIALVYHVAHYYTLIETQGVKIIALMSDPFGRGQNWFGTADWFRGSIVPELSTVWHVQVALIVFGHIVSVYMAHRVALDTFDTHRQAVVSQIPMLLLMVLFTVAGLWILSQPLAG